VAIASTPVAEGGVDDPSPTIDSAPTIEEGTGQGWKSIDLPGLPISLPNMPIA